MGGEAPNALPKHPEALRAGSEIHRRDVKLFLRHAGHLGMTVIDVNPSPIEWNFDRYTKVRMGAKEAFERGEVLKTVKGLDCGHK